MVHAFDISHQVALRLTCGFSRDGS